MGDHTTKPIPPSTRLLRAAHHTIILAFDLVGKEAKDVPGRLIQALHDISLQKEITDFLNDYSIKLMQQYNTPQGVKLKDASHLALKSLQGRGQKVGQEVLKNLSEQVQNTDAFNDLKEQLKKLGKEFTDQPVGIWFTDKKAYVIAAGILVSGAGVVFATYSGSKKLGAPTVLSKLEGQSVKMKAFGSLDLGAQIAKVDKSKGIVDFKVTGTKEWKALTFSLEVVGHASLKNLSRVEGAGVNGKVTLQVSENVQLEVKGGVDKPDFQKGAHASLEAVLRLRPSRHIPIAFNIGAGIRGNGKRSEESLSFNLEFPIGAGHSSIYDDVVQKGLDR